ncbi:HEAT repeat domain-containing protein [Vallicoccus soli]|uniref:HEAT repeat domain-containing protein n=1 Tax=Vallicoccus soli TaxID=2339232 RepID=UPI001059A32F|nr:HEAT repeat domain-containing protein [Vallicoccus soli]
MLYEEAIPVLLAWLPRTTDLGQREEIVRCLTVRWARSDALGPLLREFETLPLAPATARTENLRWAVGNALEVLWDDARYSDLVRLANDERFGAAREMLVLGFARSKHPSAADDLVTLLDDPVVDGHAVAALRKRRAAPPPEALPALERLRGDRRAWVRKEAARVLGRLT